MRPIWTVVIWLSAPLSLASREPALPGRVVPLTDTSKVRFAEASAGREVVTTRDDYVRALSPLDRQVRRRTDQAVSEEAFLKASGDQVLDWDESEVKRIGAVIAGIRAKLAPYRLPLPKTVLLVKTTGDEEGNAAYTRGAAIFLPRRMAARSEQSLEPLLLHELFHVMSRNDAEFRDRLYAVVGFKRCGAVSLPDDLAARKITNPDAPLIEHRIRLTSPGGAGDDSTTDAVPILLSRESRYDAKKGGSLFDYMQFKLLAVEPDGDQADRWRAKLKDGQPILLDPKNVASFHDQIGRNTGYIIHPEEILADNFMILIGGKRKVQTPRILDEMRKVLSPK
jgi:hypothetical protein